jgi:radical SAM protein with 4Fe4S-binding SPASM domain
MQEIAEAKARGGLLSMELELSRVCNLRCVYCYASSGQSLENELSYEEIADVILQAKALGARKIIVLGGGEPMIYPRIFDVLANIRSHGLIADVFTNGLAMTSEYAQRLFELGVGVVLKMNSRIPGVQDFLGGRSGTWEGIDRALAYLQEAGYPDGTHNLGIETIICRQNYDELPELWRWARQQGIAPYVEVMTRQGRATDHPELEVSSDEIKVLFEKLAQIDRDEFLCNWTPHPPLVASHCARHEYSCTITANGEVHPCPGVSVTAGNVREQKLAEILRDSPVIQDLRDIRNRIKGKCRVCNIADKCYGCRGHAYQTTNDYLAEDPLCWL